MKSHHPAGTALLVAILVVGLGWVVACYRCTDPSCSNLPPEPDPFETVARDADRE